VFSQSLISLNLIEDFLKASHHARDSSSLKGIVFMAKKILINILILNVLLDAASLLIVVLYRSDSAQLD